MIQSNKQFPYSGLHRHYDDAIDTILYSVHDHNGTATVEVIVSTKTIITDVYAIGSKSGLNIVNVLQDRFC